MIKFKKREFNKKLEFALAFIKSAEEKQERISNERLQKQAGDSYTSIAGQGN